MGRGASGLSGTSSNANRTSDIAENLKPGDVINPGNDNWTYHINNETVRGHVNDYVTIDSVKVGPKTVIITGHEDMSGFYEVGSKAYEEAKKRFITVTKSVKKGTSFNFRPIRR